LERVVHGRYELALLSEGRLGATGSASGVTSSRYYAAVKQALRRLASDAQLGEHLH